MKIGILTYHRTLNYGACLQAVATRIVLEKMGHEVYYVDYWPEYHSRSYEPFSWSKLLSLNYKIAILYILDTLKYYRYRKIRIQQFDIFFSKYIYPYCKSTTETYDVIVYGSDQIWRKQYGLQAYNPIYFGQNDFKTKQHIAYSASMGILPFTDEDKQTIRNLVANMNQLAVREQDLKELLESLGFTDIELTLDPTLLLSSKQWDDIIPTQCPQEDKYVLVYGINVASFDMIMVEDYAKKRGCSVKVLSGTAKSIDTDSLITTAGPESFISLIKHAECVFTSSFHGLAFSIIYHKEFYASFRSNSNRARTLLNSLGIAGRIIEGTKIPSELSPINYNSVEEKLNKRLLISKDYLVRSISKKK